MSANQKSSDEMTAMHPPITPALTKNISFSSIIFTGLLVASLIWAMLISKAVFLDKQDQSLRAVSLQPLVNEYISAQARSANTEAQITSETAQFMTALDGELRRLGDKGFTIVVAEAIVSDNVPDITQDVRSAVYAKIAIPEPKSIRASDSALTPPSLLSPQSDGQP